MNQNTEKVSILKDAFASKSALETYLNYYCVDNAEYDTLKMITNAALEFVEQHTRRAITKNRYESTLSQFPFSRREGIYLPHPPFEAIESFTYVDEDGVTQNYTDYQLDRSQKRTVIYPGVDKDWPNVQSGKHSPILITYTAGFIGHSRYTMPPALEAAIRQVVATFWQNRESVSDVMLIPIPHQLESILTAFRVPPRETYNEQSGRVQLQRRIPSGICPWYGH
jgi:uncharacterized phiE125 gp8 family phage protein